MKIIDKFFCSLIILKYNLSKITVARNVFFILTFSKVLAFFVITKIGFWFFWEAKDANLYDTMARGIYVWPHPWGDFLKILNSYGLYSRTAIATIIFLMHCSLVPWLIAKICFGNYRMNAVNWYMLVFIGLYPTMIIFSTDIFRDTPMVILFLFWVYGVSYFLTKPLKEWSLWPSLIYFSLICVSGYLLYVLRFYLLLALVISVILAYVVNLKRSLWVYLCLYFITLLLADYADVFSYLKGSYRQGYAGAGSEYGIDYSEGFFLLSYMKSGFYSILGGFIYNKISLVVFLLESVPMICLGIYIYMLRKCIDRFSLFFICFFFVYGAFWIVGTDALGTAVRYRIFNYLSISIAAFLVYRRAGLINKSDERGLLVI